MKKVFALMMVIALLAAVMVPAYAVDSPTTSIPVQVPGNVKCPGEVFLWGNRSQMPAEKRTAFEAAWDCLKEAVPEGFACRLFFYYAIEEDGHDSCTIELLMNGSKTDAAGNEVNMERQEHDTLCATYKVDMSIEGVTEVAAKEFVNNEWVDLELTFEGNSVTLKDVHDAPVALFMK